MEIRSSHAGGEHCNTEFPSPPPRAHTYALTLQFYWLERHWPFRNLCPYKGTALLPLPSMNGQKDSSCDLDPCGIQNKASGCTLNQHVQPWVDVFPFQHSGGLVQTWHNRPRASNCLNNWNIQPFVCQRLQSFAFHITTFFSP